MGGGVSTDLRCVVWHAPETRVPEPLLRRLRDRNVPITVATDPYAAMAFACRPGDPADPKHDAPRVLLLVDPDHLPRAGEVVLCLQLYAPETVPWIFDPAGGADRTLRAATREDIARWTLGADERLERFEPPDDGGVFLRLVRPDDLPSGQIEAGASEREEPRGLPRISGGRRPNQGPQPLTDEELRALLNEEPPP